jgi:hypothetical protein
VLRNLRGAFPRTDTHKPRLDAARKQHDLAAPRVAQSSRHADLYRRNRRQLEFGERRVAGAGVDADQALARENCQPTRLLAARSEQRVTERDDLLTLAEETRETVELGRPDESRPELVVGKRDQIRACGSDERSRQRSASARAATRTWRRRPSARLDVPYRDRIRQFRCAAVRRASRSRPFATLAARASSRKRASLVGRPAQRRAR